MNDELKEVVLRQLSYLICMLNQHNLQPDDTEDAHKRAFKIYEILKIEWAMND